MKRTSLLLTLIALLFASLFLGLLSLSFATLYVVWPRISSYFAFPALLALNLLPAVFLVFFLYFLSNSAWFSYLLSSVVILGGTFANFFKVVLRDECVVFEDLADLGAAVGIAGQYEISLSMPFYLAIFLDLLVCALLFFFCRGKLPGWKQRTAGAVLSLGLITGAFFLWYGDENLYRSFSNDRYFNQWKPTEHYASRGFLYPFLHSAAQAIPHPPEGYSRQRADELLAEYPDRDLDTKVNFVAIMLESFSELDVNFVRDPYGPWKDLKAESYAGLLLSDTMGGGTVNAERAFLTGFSFPQPAYRGESHSFVRYFKSQGYEAEGLHPGHDWFYNRKSINKNLGFDRYFFSENLFSERTDLEYAGDDVFFPAVREKYLEGKRPYFSFSVSYQNHSPYDDTALTWGTEYVARDGLTDAAYYTVNNYLGGIADTAERVSDFVDSFRDDREPVVLILFGDHRPTLGPSNGYYEQLGLSQDRRTGEGFANTYAVPYLIWANDAAKTALGRALSGTGPTLSPCYLLPQALDVCGLTGPGWAMALSEASGDLPLRHSTGVFWSEDGPTENLSEAQKKLLENLSFMEYTLRK